jgi:ADP-heptose:LPS heptosyltransferase
MNLPAMAAERSIRTVGIAPYTSDFAPERMMPEDVWIEVLRQEIAHDEPCRVYLFGSLKTKGQADHFIDTASRYFIRADFINLSGVCSLAEAAGTLKSLDQFWSVDSGLLHIARLLRVPCRSFWGPTNPLQRLRLIDGLNEKVFYKNFSCSPCVHLSSPPCAGNNLCMKTMAEDNPDRNPEWPTK